MPRHAPRTRESKRKQIFPLTWIWVVVVVVVVAATGSTANVYYNGLYPDADVCKKISISEVTCELKGVSQDYLLDDFTWNNFTKMTIYGQGNKLHIQQPLCGHNQRELHVYNASRVTTDNYRNNCSLQLILYHCRGVNILGGVNLVRMTSSEADKVILPSVSQFDLHDSSVREVSLIVHGKKSTLKNSEIDFVNKLVITGSFVFEVTDSTLGVIKFFVYDSHKTTTFLNMTVGQVFSNGFQVRNGNLNLDNSRFNTLAARGIMVMPKANLKFNFGKIQTASEDAIVVTPNGKMSLKNMMIGRNHNVSFTLSDASMELYPLAFFTGPWMPSIAWIAIGVVFGLAVGSVTSAAVIYYVRKEQWFMKKVDTRELLNQEQTSIQTETEVPPPKTSNKNLPKIVPGPPNIPLPNRPLPDVPGNMNEGDVYVDVISSISPIPTQMLPPPGITQRPSIPVPKEATPANPLRHFSIKDRFRSKPNFVPPIISTNKQDFRDGLPPPPPPVDDGEELYDMLEDITMQMPQPPPAANKPKLLFSNKPLPPSATRKPKKP